MEARTRKKKKRKRERERERKSECAHTLGTSHMFTWLLIRSFVRSLTHIWQITAKWYISAFICHFRRTMLNGTRRTKYILYKWFNVRNCGAYWEKKMCYSYRVSDKRNRVRNWFQFYRMDGQNNKVFYFWL